MDYRKFVLPEMKRPFDAEQANRGTQKQLRILSLIAVFLSLFSLMMCYLTSSLPVFLTLMAISALFLLGLQAFHKRVADIERGRALSKTFLPAEELALDPNGYHWNQKGPQPLQVDIPWEDVRRISFDPLDYVLLYGRNQKLPLPRIVSENQNEIMEFIEQNLDLEKTVQEERWRDEDYTAVFYSRREPDGRNPSNSRG